jgi:hypothetical protein
MDFSHPGGLRILISSNLMSILKPECQTLSILLAIAGNGGRTGGDQVPDEQPQQPPDEGQRAEGSAQPAGEQPRPIAGTVTPGADGPAETRPDAGAPLNGSTPPGEPGWLDDEDELGGLVLVPGSEPVPADRLLIAEPAGPGGSAGGGLCWSFDVDLDSILAAAAKAAAGPGCGQGMLAGLAGQAGDGPASDSAAAGSPGAGVVPLPDEGGLGLDVAAEYLPGSAGLAAWLDQRDPAGTSDYDLPAVAAGWRRVAAWAQAREFAAVAQIAARSAARHQKTGLEEDGRPAAVTPDAAAQVALALALSPGTAEWWTSQAITLTWRLPATGAALAAGQIDAYRARLITEATSLLDEDTARAVENDVLPEAGELTYAQLRSRLRKAVIIADPEGAEERRKAAERRARVSLYPDDDGTATLTGTSLPAPHAAAAMARITALARALKASGAGGGIDLLRAHIFIGLLLGTLPPIPPPADAGQPDEPTDDNPPPDDPPRGGGPGRPRDDGQPSGPRSDSKPGSPPPGDGHGRPAGTPGSHGRPGGTPPGGGEQPGQRPGPPHGTRPPRDSPTPRRGQLPDVSPPLGDRSSGSPAPSRDEHSGNPVPRRDEPAGTASGDPPPGGTQAGRGTTGDFGGVADPWPEMPTLTDADAPESDDGYADPPPEPSDDDRLRYGEDPLDLPDTGPMPVWPPVPGTTGTRPFTATGASAASSDGSEAGAGAAAGAASAGRPAAGMLDLTLSWATFARSASAPGFLGRIGPVTAAQARALAAAAAMAPGTRWRVILTDGIGRAVKTATVTRLPVTRQPGTRSRPARGPAAGTPTAPARTAETTTQSTKVTADSPGTIGPMLPLVGPVASITGRVSVTIPLAALDHIMAAELAGTSTRAAILRAAARAAAKVRGQATADQETGSGCAHTAASPAYRPPVTIRDLIEARDQTCRFPGCRQPAWRGDLDHTTPFHRGGLTCPCNLGPLCRRHHRLKQEQHWKLAQTSPGTFQWKTPAGRIHITTVHQHSP